MLTCSTWAILFLLTAASMCSGVVPSTINAFPFLKRGSFSFSFTCGGATALVIVVSLPVPPSNQYQVLLSNIGSTSGLLGNNFTVEVNTQNATAFSILVKAYSSICPSLTYNVRSFVIYPEENPRFIAVNNIPVTSAAGLTVAMPRATTTTNPSVFPFLNSVVTNSGAKFSVNATLVNTTHVRVYANRFVGCSTLYVSYLVVETLSGTIYWHTAVIQMTSSLSFPTYDASQWTDFFFGLVTYNVFNDFNWSCSGGPLACTTLSNHMQVNVLFISNVTCTPNSVINVFNFSISPTCNCSLGYWANLTVCSSCHYSCNDCSAGTSGDCLACDQTMMRKLDNNQCSCVEGYYDSGVPLCSTCNSSFYCSTCNTSTTCSSCDSSLLRFLSASLKCECINGYYDTGVARCVACQYMCATCSNASSCTSCPSGANRNVNDMLLCSCLNGYYESGKTVCTACSVQCQTCTDSSKCLTCNNSNFRKLVATSCPCMTGYYNNTLTYPTCMRCPTGCAACTSLISCSACSYGYALNSGVCVLIPVVVLNLTVTTVQQSLNSLIINIDMSTKVVFLTGVESALSLWNNGVSIPYTVVSISNRTNPTTVKVMFTLTQGLQNITIVFTNDSMVTSNRTLAVAANTTAQLPSYYLFSNQQKNAITTLSKYVVEVVGDVNYGRGGFAVLGFLYIFSAFTQFTQLMSYYIFMDLRLSPNLSFQLEQLYYCQQIPILPISLDPPFPDTEVFQRPGRFDIYGFSFNFIHTNFVLFLEILALLLCYYILNYISLTPPANCLSILFRKRYLKTLYANSVEAYLSSHIGLAFGSFIAFASRELNSRFKIFNWSAMCVFAFIAIVLPFFHVLVLRMCKQKEWMQNVEDCYYSAEKRYKLSELYIFSRMIVSTAVVMSTPLCTPLMSVLIVFVACLFHGIVVYRCKFIGRVEKIFRLIYVTGHLSIQLCYGAICFGSLMHLSPAGEVILGYVTIALIVINIVLDCLTILFELAKVVYFTIKYWKGSKRDSKVEVVETVVQRPTQLKRVIIAKQKKYDVGWQKKTVVTFGLPPGGGIEQQTADNEVEYKHKKILKCRKQGNIGGVLKLT